jgi:hypothetical protein
MIRFLLRRRSGEKTHTQRRARREDQRRDDRNHHRELTAVLAVTLGVLL